MKGENVMNNNDNVVLSEAQNENIENEKTGVLSDKELDLVCDTLSDVRNSAPKHPHQNSLEDEENEIDLIAKEVEIDSLDVDIFQASNPDLLDSMSQEKLISTVKSGMDLSDEDAIKFIECIDEFRANKNANIYSRLPGKIKRFVDGMLTESGIPMHKREEVARMVLTEFINDENLEAAFVDLEQALNETLKIPGLLDMYNSHTKEVMEKNIPEMAERIRDEYPDKADKLLSVKDAFERSYTFASAKEAYEKESKIRKKVRRADSLFKRVLDEFNYKNIKTRFKIYDIFKIFDALMDMIHSNAIDEQIKFYTALNEPAPDSLIRIKEMDISSLDIKKFCVLLAASCECLDADDIIDASYMYYLTKNIISLKYAKNAKTDFTVELINNICDVIALIRNKEAEFYAEKKNMDKSKSPKKPYSPNGAKKRN